ncbi:hypothetical protein SEUCBS139899_004248 [Sporothrix eucalyptigena]|uniref:Chitin-binding type-1 domain-containing protein n=1 Tax=Sporothrix eucalyptigena TaxID=1812306 RepID=A0ABP0AZZ6_9PEZI
MTRPARPRWTLVAAITALFFGSALALQVSPDGTCGGTTGFTCEGSAAGPCCSPHGYCGSGDAYCGSGCDQSGGNCNFSPGISVGVPKPTGELGGTANPGIATCPVCSICPSPSPSEVPSSCRVILTATRWTTATKTVVVGENGSAVATEVSTVTATKTSTRVLTTTRTIPGDLSTKTATVTQTLVRTETVTVGDACPVAAPALPDTVTGVLESAATPSPILPGVVPGCRRWYKTPPDTVDGGSTCGSVADAAGISKDDLRLWNTRVGNTTDDTTICEGPQQLALLASNLCRVRCGDVWGGYYLCVGTAASSTAASVSSPRSSL